jgi:hypothetical protein
MSILDEAIREHLELKRRHGADDSELKQLEDEAFGPAERPGTEESAPDAVAEAPTEFMTPEPVAPEEEGSRREPSLGIADLQEGPEQAQPAEEPESVEEELPAEELEDEPAEEEHPAMEHEAVPEVEEPPVPTEPSTEERHAIAEQPTELFDVEGEIAASESRSPTDEELLEEGIQEPRLAPLDPLAELEDVDEDDVGVEVEARVEEAAVEDDFEDGFFDEQRLSEELDQALEAPAPAPVPDEEIEEDIVEDEDFEDEDEDEADEAPDEADPPTGDVLGATPDFLEETPEDDQLWFEQKPPKDFDFDD